MVAEAGLAQLIKLVPVLLGLIGCPNDGRGDGGDSLVRCNTMLLQ